MAFVSQVSFHLSLTDVVGRTGTRSSVEVSMYVRGKTVLSPSQKSSCRILSEQKGKNIAQSWNTFGRTDAIWGRGVMDRCDTSLETHMPCVKQQNWRCQFQTGDTQTHTHSQVHTATNACIVVDVVHHVYGAKAQHARVTHISHICSGHCGGRLLPSRRTSYAVWIPTHTNTSGRRIDTGRRHRIRMYLHMHTTVL